MSSQNGCGRISLYFEMPSVAGLCMCTKDGCTSKRSSSVESCFFPCLHNFSLVEILEMESLSSSVDAFPGGGNLRDVFEHAFALDQQSIQLSVRALLSLLVHDDSLQSLDVRTLPYE